MIWPIGQPVGGMHAMALRSREIWLDALQAAKMNYRPTGSLHLAYHGDEADVLREFAETGPGAGYECEWLSAEATIGKSHAVKPEGLRGSLWSSTELTVDPREVIRKFPLYLQETGVELRYGTPVRQIALPLVDAGAERWEVETAIVC